MTIDLRRELEDLRRQMADADLDILKGIERRALLARQVGKLRDQVVPSLSPPPREQLDALEKMSNEFLAPGSARAIFREIHAATLSLEGRVRVAYVGPAGGMGLVATFRRFGHSAERIACADATQAFDAVARDRADFALVPFESSTTGPVQSTLSALAVAELVLVGEVEVSTVLSLMSQGGVLREIQTVQVYAGDREQTQACVTRLVPHAQIVDVLSPASAAQAAKSDPSVAAVLSQSYGESEGLTLLEASMGEAPDHHFRYAVAAVRPAARSGNDTTLLLFGVHDQPGALFEILKHFAERGVNLKTLQSRPVVGAPGQYLFFLEVVGHPSDRAIVTALESTKRQARLVKVLGSFPT